jgi:hypothetical protein
MSGPIAVRTYFSRQKGEIDGRFLGNREEGGRDDKGLGGGRRRSSFARTNGQTIGYSRRSKRRLRSYVNPRGEY